MRARGDRWPEPDEVIELSEPGCGLEGVLVIDSTVRGSAAGGIRRTHYPNLAAAQRDAERLARAMTLKCALAELPAGGAKTVLLDRPDLDVPEAYRALGRVIDQLDGRYLSGPDVGTGEAELDHVRSVTEHVNPQANEPNRSTAKGVLAGIRGTLRAIDGEAAPAGHRFVVQGLGGVGWPVARALAQRDAQVLATDLDPMKLERADEAGIDVLDPEQATSTLCDVFVPCALGEVITVDVAQTIPTRAICGSANNPLEGAEAGRILHERGIAYAPDVIVNAGAVIEGVLTTCHGRTEATLHDVEARIEGIEDRVTSILSSSLERERPPSELVLEQALETLRLDA